MTTNSAVNNCIAVNDNLMNRISARIRHGQLNWLTAANLIDLDYFVSAKLDNSKDLIVRQIGTHLVFS